MRSFVARADPNFEGFSRLHGADSAAGQYAPMDPIMALLRLNVRFGGAHLGRTQPDQLHRLLCHHLADRCLVHDLFLREYDGDQAIRADVGRRAHAGIGRPIFRSGVAPN